MSGEAGTGVAIAFGAYAPMPGRENAAGWWSWVSVKWCVDGPIGAGWRVDGVANSPQR